MFSSAKKHKLRQSTAIKAEQNRRHSLRLNAIIKPRPIIRETRRESIILSLSCLLLFSLLAPKWRKVENEVSEDNSSNNDEDDDFDALLARHHRLTLEEQKDRKLYERYVRGQRTLRRLQCRRTHTAHLNEATRNRLLRELERERRHTVQDQICTYRKLIPSFFQLYLFQLIIVADHTIIFRHGCQINPHEPMTWSSLEDEIPRQKHIDTIHQLDVMINNLKKVMRTTKSSM